jgi:SAM-dependent methyltransferase
MDLKETDVLGDAISRHWYYRSKARAVERLLGARPVQTILDVGAGSGFFSRHLLSHSAARDAWCVDISYRADSDSQEAGKPVRFRRHIDAAPADLVLMMDVLEHVDDDVGLLAEYVAKVPSGSRFLISVPAFAFLWSDHDVFLEHRRRYTLPQVESVAERAGLKLQCGTYYFAGVFPIAATLRLFQNLFGQHARQPRSQLKQHSPLVNETLAAVSGAELPVLKHNRLAGLTVFCVAEKP